MPCGEAASLNATSNAIHAKHTTRAGAAADAAAEVDEDEAVFQAKQRRRLAKDTGKLAPRMLGGPAGSHPAAPPLRGAGPAPAGAAQPARDFAGFESVGGLGGVLQQLREVVLLPLLRPELCRQLGIQVPRCA